MKDTYALLDSGDGKKLERFGPYTMVRPAGQAIWTPTLPKKEWDKADARFTREEECQWLKKISGEWFVEIKGIRFQLSTTDFGHLGIFPEQKEQWLWMQSQIKKAGEKRSKPVKVLNLFAYSGGATLFTVAAGAEVCHLDASKGMVSWARENATLNGFDKKPIRWIVDDVRKFLLREHKRDSKYDAIILDPPTYGRGSKGEVFKFERDLPELMEQCRNLLSEDPLFLVLSCHTPTITPVGLENVLRQVMAGVEGKIEHGELLLEGSKDVLPLPSGIYARWRCG